MLLGELVGLRDDCGVGRIVVDVAAEPVSSSSLESTDVEVPVGHHSASEAMPVIVLVLTFVNAAVSFSSNALAEQRNVGIQVVADLLPEDLDIILVVRERHSVVDHHVRVLLDLRELQGPEQSPLANGRRSDVLEVGLLLKDLVVMLQEFVSQVVLLFQFFHLALEVRGTR